MGSGRLGRLLRLALPLAKTPGFRGYKARLVANLREPGRLAALQAMLRGSKADVEPLLDRVKAPALVVMGTKDPDFPDPAAEARLVADRLHGQVGDDRRRRPLPTRRSADVAAPLIIDFIKRHASRLMPRAGTDAARA